MNVTGARRTQRRLDRARLHSRARAVSAPVDTAARWSRDAHVLRSSWPAATTMALAVCLLLAMPVQPARAGTYEMWNCSVPGRSSSLLHPWLATEWVVPNVSMIDACATGGGWSVNLAGARQVVGGWGAALTLSRPTGARSQIEFVKFTVWYAARLAGTGQPMYFVWSNYRPDGSHLTPVMVPPDAENAVAEFDLDPDTAHAQLAFRCSLSEVVSVSDPCVAAHNVPLLIRGLKVTLREETPPTVSRFGGALFDPNPQRGTRTVTYAASDAQSGLSKIEALLDDVVVATNDLTGRCSYSDFTVCPVSDDGTLQADTRAVSNGPHHLMLRVHDAAGNIEEVHEEHAVIVANEAGPNSTAASADTAYMFSAHFTGSSRSTLTAPYGRRVTIRGRLARTNGTVAQGSRIEVLERRDQRGAREISRAPVMTKRDGSFSVVLDTTQPSRTVRMAYRPPGTNRVVSTALKLEVRAASRLHGSLRGRILRFSGRVLSRPITKGGKRVLMEGRSPGSAWTRFRSLRTDRNGRFSGTYRLRVRRPGVVLKIRALVPSENGYGYVSSRSRSVALRVR